MKLWYIHQDENTGYDTFDAAVVAAPDETTARTIHPSGHVFGDAHWNADTSQWLSAWASSPREVTAEYLGEAKDGTEQGVIISSFNAG